MTLTQVPADSVSKNYLRRWMIPTGCEYNTKLRFSHISRTSWNWDFTKSMSSGEEEREEVIGGSGSDRGSVGDDSLACMTSYLWNSVMKTRHQQTLARDPVFAIVVGCFSRIKTVLGRIERRTRETMYCQSIRTV